MKVEINVDESMFKDVIDRELAALSPEELKDVVLECVRHACVNLKDLDTLLVKKKNYYDSQLYPTQLFENIIKNILTPEDFADVKAVLLEAIRNRMPEIIAIMIKNIFANAITDTEVIDSMSKRFSDMVEAIVLGRINERLNKN